MGTREEHALWQRRVPTPRWVQGTSGAGLSKDWTPGRQEPQKCCGEKPTVKPSLQLPRWDLPTEAASLFHLPSTLLRAIKRRRFFYFFPLKQFKSIIPLPFNSSMVKALKYRCLWFNPLRCLGSEIPPSAPGGTYPGMVWEVSVQVGLSPGTMALLLQHRRKARLIPTTTFCAGRCARRGTGWT